jgi:myosin heavy subunit
MKTPQDGSSDKNRDLGPMEEEMIKRREIKREEKEYQDNMGRAKEVAELGSQLEEAFERTKTLSRDDARKLDRLEKLTRKIRSEAGGSDEDEPLQDPPRQLEPAVKKLAEVSQALWKVVEKTPKRVVSANVIEQANVLLELTRYTRKLIQ